MGIITAIAAITTTINRKFELRQQLITGPKRKRIVVASLGVVGLTLFLTSTKLAFQEGSLPLTIQLDEARLLEPNNVDTSQESSALQFLETNESRLSDYVQCSAAAGVESKQACLAIIDQMLNSDPANGRLWLEKAKVLAGESGLDEQAITALKKSYEYSGREGWVSIVRAKFALSVWSGLPEDMQETAAKNLIATITDDLTQMPKIVDLYAQNPLARAGITAVIAKAPVEMQQRFLYLLRSSLKT